MNVMKLCQGRFRLDTKKCLCTGTAGSSPGTKPDKIQELFGKLTWYDSWGCLVQGQELAFDYPSGFLPNQDILSLCDFKWPRLHLLCDTTRAQTKILLTLFEKFVTKFLCYNDKEGSTLSIFCCSLSMISSMIL